MERLDPGQTKMSSGGRDPRGPVDKDYGRVLHSGAFRRLQGKSQVVSASHADWFRTRLTHTLEVAQIARDMAKRLRISDPAVYDSDYGPTLVEVGALIHDLGHPPFGHNGEDALKDWMRSVGSSFEANAQSYRVVTRLEVKYAANAQIGLNLTLETLAASLKYPWPQDTDKTRKAYKKFGYYEDDAASAEAVLDAVLPERPSTSERGRGRKHAAAEIVDWADDIAYSVHDLEDGIRARLIPIHYIVSAPASAERQMIVDEAASHDAKDSWDGHPELSTGDLDAALTRLITDTTLRDLTGPYRHLDGQRGTMKQLTSELIERFTFGLTPVRARTKEPLRVASDLKRVPKVKAEIEILKAINWAYVIKSRQLQTLQYRERKVVTELAQAFMSYGENLLPEEDARRYLTALDSDIAESANPNQSREDFLKGERQNVPRWDMGPLPGGEAYPKARRARVVCDYVAGMTDRFAERSHARLLGLEPQAVSDYI